MKVGYGRENEPTSFGGGNSEGGRERSMGGMEHVQATSAPGVPPSTRKAQFVEACPGGLPAAALHAATAPATSPPVLGRQTSFSWNSSYIRRDESWRIDHRHTFARRRSDRQPRRAAVLYTASRRRERPMQRRAA